MTESTKTIEIAPPANALPVKPSVESPVKPPPVKPLVEFPAKPSPIVESSSIVDPRVLKIQRGIKLYQR